MNYALGNASQRPTQQTGSSMATKDDDIGAAGMNRIERYLCWIANQRHFFMPQTCLLKLLDNLSKIGVGRIHLL